MKESLASRIELEKVGRGGERTHRIDWAQIHERLKAGEAALEQRMTPGPAEKRQILSARAKLLAREVGPGEKPTASVEVVEFVLAHEHYAVEAKSVRQIQPLRDLTPLPCTPPFILGLISVRGQILSVIDIKKFLGLRENGLTDLNKVIVVRTDRMELGIVADEILGVRFIELGGIQPSLPTLMDVRAEFLRGVTKDSVVVLDIEKLLSARRIVVDGDGTNPTSSPGLVPRAEGRGFNQVSTPPKRAADTRFTLPV
jgi:purine-binding chemotaxis protein CheW